MTELQRFLWGLLSMNQEVTIKLSEELVEEVNQVRKPGESQDETIFRLLQYELVNEPRYRYRFALLAVSVTVLWALTYVFVGPTESNAIGGIYIAVIALWAVWREFQIKGNIDYRT